MRSLSAFLLIVFGVLALALSVGEHVWVPMVDPYGQWAALQDNLPTLVLVSSATAFVCVSAGVFVLWRGGGAAERWRPYTTALSRLAAEHGQRIEIDRRKGLEFLAFRDGQRIHVTASEAVPPSMVVRGIVPGRQVLTFVRTEDARPDPTGRSQVVGGGKGWQLRAEFPTIARTLLNDVVMVSMMDRYFAHRESVAVVHDATGSQVQSQLPTPDQVEKRARQAIDIVSYLRRVNG